jgi:phytoene synthase
MSAEPAEPLPPEAELALAWSPRSVRGPLTTALQLDRRLARIVARNREPMLGQMRLAWWREAIAKPVEVRPRGDVVLDAIGEHWAGREASLAKMIDGWEVLVSAERIGADEARAFGSLRGAFFAGLAEHPGEAAAERLVAAGCRWALADAATAISDATERAAIVEAGLAVAPGSGRIPSPVRGLGVLEALAMRALRRGGRPLMEGRGAPLTALRAAIFRR